MSLSVSNAKEYCNIVYCVYRFNSRSRHISICILGVIFNSSLNFRKHIYPKQGHAFIISATCVEFENVCLYLLPNKLHWSAANCNSLSNNSPKKDIGRLQRVQNCLASTVTKAPRFSRSVSLLKQLHSLPVKFRIHLKMCTITFRNLNKKTYLAKILELFTLHKFK